MPLEHRTLSAVAALALAATPSTLNAQQDPMEGLRALGRTYSSVSTQQPTAAENACLADPDEVTPGSLEDCIHQLNLGVERFRLTLEAVREKVKVESTGGKWVNKGAQTLVPVVERQKPRTTKVVWVLGPQSNRAPEPQEKTEPPKIVWPGWLKKLLHK